MKLYRIICMSVSPSFTKQLWAITGNTDVCDNKYKDKWGQQETCTISKPPHPQFTSVPAQHSTLHWTSYHHTPARGLEKLRQSHCRKSDSSPNESVLPHVNFFTGLKELFCSTSDYNKLLNVIYHMSYCL